MVIPAHDEAAVIERTLSALLAADGAERWQVVVVCNGCTDDTAARARRDGVTVVEIEAASKVAALNRGDAEALGYPRVYLDADIELSPGALAELRACLPPGPARLAAPALVVDLAGCAALVRAFYRIYLSLPYLREGLVGAGCYAMNAEGRARFASFPQITADDLFVQGLFTQAEREVLAATFTARAPRTLSSLLAVRTRTYFGNAEAVARGQAGTMTASRTGSLAALRRLVREQPARLPDAAVYVAVNLFAQRRAARRRPGQAWLRDESSRA